MLLVLCSIAGWAEETTSLEELVQLRDTRKNLSFDRRPLEKGWKGDVIDFKSDNIKLRLSHGGIAEGEIRLYSASRRSASLPDSATLVAKLPKPEDVTRFTTLDELETHFGHSQIFTSVWGDTKRKHWTVGWSLIASEPEQRVRYLNVVARVSSKATGGVSGQASVDEMRVSHGLLIQEDGSDRGIGNGVAPVGIAVASDLEDDHAVPLRELLKVVNDHDDSELVEYRRYLNNIRSQPDPRLFKQLVAEIDEGTPGMRMHLDNILAGSWVKLDPWETKQQTLAINSCLDSLLRTKGDEAVRDVAVIILKMSGGGSVDIPNRDDRSGTRIEVHENGYSQKALELEISLRQAYDSLSAIAGEIATEDTTRR